jgi:hypothetical protein
VPELKRAVATRVREILEDLYFLVPQFRWESFRLVMAVRDRGYRRFILVSALSTIGSNLAFVICPIALRHTVIH